MDPMIELPRSIVERALVLLGETAAKHSARICVAMEDALVREAQKPIEEAKSAEPSLPAP